MVRWEEIPLFDDPDTFHSFMVSLNRDGSAYYIYKSVDLFLPLSLQRSILRTHSSTSKGSWALGRSSRWATTPTAVPSFPPLTTTGIRIPAVRRRGMIIDGNYVNLDLLNSVLEGIMNQQTAGIDDYAYSFAVAMCLMPTEFCVFPRTVGLERSSVECSSKQWFPSKSPSTFWPAETTPRCSFAVISEKPESTPLPRRLQKSPRF